MLTTARVDLPVPVEVRLKNEALFTDNVNDYARDDLIGFKRPIAAAFALVAPVALALAYQGQGFSEMLQLAMVFVAIVGGGVYLIGKQEWPKLVVEFQEHALAKRRAVADLRCGFGESSFLSHGRSPRFFEHEHGVLVLADAGDLKTLFFSIESDEGDPRWALYLNGELHRRVWRWLRLPISREVVKFSTEGSKLARILEAPMIDSIDAWEAVNVALGEPCDGAIIHRCFDELCEVIDRMI
ncbi:MAG: hypothetical protein GXP04_00985 [Alphaproteobacteria bacterium]|nr:hypothetical protein [Marinicaulis sp.]NOX93700.1 hypothetical protein [Alphaproteobacteria bacterium]